LVDCAGLPNQSDNVTSQVQILSPALNLLRFPSFEEDYFKKLDSDRIYYESEKLRFVYFDTQLNRERVAIPDIFIPSDNLIIEIKSDWTYNEKNMDDKIKEYKNGKKLFENIEIKEY
jgi:hypothetical protein